MTNRERPEVLIEKWLPVDIIGAESLRDASAAQKPPLNRLHVWWARRPLTTSRAAILASVLPAWSETWPTHLREKFPTERAYQAWFLKALGILGNPAATRRRITKAKDTGEDLGPNPYGYKRAFTLNPSAEILETIGDLLEHAWGQRTLSVLDPFAGGGSIPFEAMRYGFETYANELNSVASVILKATLEYPAKFGPGLAEDIRKYGRIIADRVKERLEPFFPVEPGESIHAYIWARTVKCPYTGKPIPLSPNWWLQKGSDPVAVRPIFRPEASEATFEIVRGKAACEKAQPDKGTVNRGTALSGWAGNQAIKDDDIRAEAQAGRIGQQLYAVAVKRRGGVEYREPSEKDIAAARASEAELIRRLPAWRNAGMVPDELVGACHAKYDPRRWGLTQWERFFAPRQLLSLCTFLDEFRNSVRRIQLELPKERAEGVTTMLALALDKAVDYGSRLCKWDGTRVKVTNTFDRHDFSFKWSHAEFDAAHNLFPWVIGQVADAFQGITDLVVSPETTLQSSLPPGTLNLRRGNAADLSDISSGSLSHICTDPPYEANVMYAELSDFFYVWQKRSLGSVHPSLFAEEQTNKEDEAVANEARFASMGRKKKELALKDYQNKMAAAFREMHRVLRDDGVLTVMFTHKKVDAWDSLASSLIGAGFTIHSSWPVHTESEHSLHQAKKNAAQSTILLSCRKRLLAKEPVWWDDIKERVRRTAREKAEEFARQGIKGVDLYIATFGPTLAILSENWPVLTSEADEITGKPKPLRPEVALDLAREQVIAFRKKGLLLDKTIQFDPVTDWYLMAWDAFKAAEFPADEARKLALALGLDMERQLVAEKRIVTKKASSVVLREPADRRKKGMVDPDKTAFDCILDAAHTAMLLYQEDGPKACEAFLKAAGLRQDEAFKALLQALINAIPRTQSRGKFIRSEAAALDSLRDAFFEDLVIPIEEEPVPVEKQGELFGSFGEAASEDDEGTNEDDEEDD